MRWKALLLLLLGALLCSPAARADEGSEREARALFAQGNQRVQEGDYAGALGLFQRAYALFPSVKILLNIGTVQRQLGRNADAANAYDAYLRDAASDPGKREEVERLLADLDRRVGKLRVAVDDAAARVRVDDQPAAQSGPVVLVRVEPGTHTVSAQREGAPPASTSVTAAPGVQAEVPLHLLPGGADRSGPGGDSQPRTGRRVGGLVVGGVGALGLAAGGVTGILALLDHGYVQSMCPLHQGCTQDVANRASAGRALSWASTVALAAGATGVGVGVYLLLSEGKQGSSPRASLTLFTTGGHLGIRGAL